MKQILLLLFTGLFLAQAAAQRVIAECTVT
ncbi:MAG: hypothetical protein RIR90_2010, partial [Bacteroidota bacterium]